MFRQRVICGAALIAAIIAFSASAASAVHHYRRSPHRAAALPVWNPNSQLLEQLDSEVPILGLYAVRPPQGYSLVMKDVPTSATILHSYVWRCSPRPDGSFGGFTVIVAHLPALRGLSAQQRRIQLNNLTNVYLLAIRKFFRSWTRTLNQRGIINGIVFERSFQKGPAAANPNLTVHGFGYDALIGTDVIIMGSLDREPYSQDSLDLAEAAAMTFHKRS